MLVVVAGEPLHGYGIRKGISELTEGRLVPSIATLYENVARMVSSGLIESAGEKVIGGNKVRKLYRITGLGQQVLSTELAALDRVQATARSQSWGLQPNAVPGGA